MSRGRVYQWTPDSANPSLGTLTLTDAPLLRLDNPERLCGPYVDVRNGGVLNLLDTHNGAAFQRIPNAMPSDGANFLFLPGRGGARVDRASNVNEESLRSYVETSHFAEVNTYFHVDRMAEYIHGLLAELGASPLPQVVAIVHAHNAASRGEETRDGIRRRGDWAPFQGGHYRLPSETYDVPEPHPLSVNGEIHLGSGRRRLPHGALARLVGRPYRHNAGHNPGIIYHEYGHHVNRHTADFRANRLRVPDQQSNRKVALDEGTCDYWTAVMLKCPSIWACHRRNDEHYVHPRSLTSRRTMADFDHSSDADPHTNGTIWAAALWDFRNTLSSDGRERLADLIVLKGLLLTGRIHRADRPATCRARSRFKTGLAALLLAEQLLSRGQWRADVLAAFASRGIQPGRSLEVGH